MKNKKNQREDEKKKLLLLVVFMVGVIVLVIATSYAWFQAQAKGGSNIIQAADGLQLEILDDEKTINLEDQMPMSDQYAMQEDHVETYEFNLYDGGVANVDYYLTVVDEVTDLPRNVLRYSISDDNGLTWSEAKSFYTTEIYDGSIAPGETTNFKIKIWVAYDTELEYAGKTYTGHINVVTKTPDDMVKPTPTPEPEPEPEPDTDQTDQNLDQTQEPTA